MMTMRTTARKWRSKRMCPLENHKNSDLDTPHPPPLVLPTPPQYIKRASETEFGILVSKLSKLFDFSNDIGIGFGKFWYRKKYRYRFQKFMVSKKVLVSKNLVSKKYQILKILLKKQEIISKIYISRGGDACFCQSGNPLKNIKGWRCFFLLMTGNPLKNIKGWRCLFEKRDEIDDDD